MVQSSGVRGEQSGNLTRYPHASALPWIGWEERLTTHVQEPSVHNVWAISFNPFIGDRFAVRLVYVLETSEEPSGAPGTWQVE